MVAFGGPAGDADRPAEPLPGELPAGFEWNDGHVVQADDGSGCQPGENLDLAALVSGRSAETGDSLMRQVPAELLFFGQERPEMKERRDAALPEMTPSRRRAAQRERGHAHRAWRRQRNRERAYVKRLRAPKRAAPARTVNACFWQRVRTDGRRTPKRRRSGSVRRPSRDGPDEGPPPDELPSPRRGRAT